MRLLILLLASLPAALALDPEIAVQPPPVLVNPGGDYLASNRPWQGIPGIDRSPGGRLWATWYSGPLVGEGPWNYVVLVSSGDDGKTWSDAHLVIDPPDPVRAYDPVIWTDPSGKLWLFWAQSAGQWDGRGGVWAVTTENPDSASPHWSEPRRLADGVMMNKPTVVDGDWLLPISGWRHKQPDIAERTSRMDFPNPEEAHRLLARPHAEHSGSTVYVSSDQGETFTYQGQAMVERPQYDEHMVVEREDGALWMLIRTAYGIGESVSSDGGRTWSEGGPSGIPHPVSRFHIRRLQSGKLLLVRHVPNAENPRLRTDLTAYVSDDDGHTWQGGLTLDDRDHVSYPDAVEAPDGTLYVIYDRERGDAREILMARITEQDILAGKTVSGDSRLRLLVSKATGKQ